MSKRKAAAVEEIVPSIGDTDRGVGSSDSSDSIEETVGVGDAQESRNEGLTSSSISKPKRGKKSIVWTVFTELQRKEGEVKRAKCNYCSVTYQVEGGKHGTSNMRRHMKTCKNRPGQEGPMDDYTISYVGGNEGNVHNEMKLQKYDANLIRQKLVEWIVCDEMSFRVVESAKFKDLMRTCEPRFQVPSRITIARDVFKLYCAEKDKLKAAFKGNVGRVSITTDTWTSSNNVNYMCVTAHFLDRSWEMHKRIISFRVIEDHRGESIGKQLEQVFKDWGLEKIMCITLDNARGNDVAVDWIKKYGTNHVLGGEHIHVRCFAHVLNILVKYGLQKSDPSIERIRTAVKYVRSSPKRHKKILECVEAVGILCSQGLRCDVPTRWNSTYLMLEAAEKYEKAFDRLFDDDAGYRRAFESSTVLSSPGFDDWEKARKLIPFLKPFFTATSLLSGTSYVTINQYFGQFCKIRNLLRNANQNPESLVNDIATEMMVKYDEYFGNLNKVNLFVYVSLVLDPRSKLEVVKKGLMQAFTDDGVAQDLYGKTEALLRKMFEEYSIALGAPLVTSTSRGNAPRSSSEEADFLGLFDIVCEGSDDPNSGAESELDMYLVEARQKPIVDWDVLTWWKVNDARYPILASMARDLFGIPASSVASESAFSTGGRVITDRRNSLRPTTVEALLCTQSWLNNVSTIDNEEVIVDDDTAEMIEAAAIEGTVLIFHFLLTTFELIQC